MSCKQETQLAILAATPCDCQECIECRLRYAEDPIEDYLKNCECDLYPDGVECDYCFTEKERRQYE